MQLKSSEEIRTETLDTYMYNNTQKKLNFKIKIQASTPFRNKRSPNTCETVCWFWKWYILQPVISVLTVHLPSRIWDCLLSADNVHSPLTLCQWLPPCTDWNNHTILICFPYKKAWGHSFIMIRSSLIVQINLSTTLETPSFPIWHKSKPNLRSDVG